MKVPSCCTCSEVCGMWSSVIVLAPASITLRSSWIRNVYFSPFRLCARNAIRRSTCPFVLVLFDVNKCSGINVFTHHRTYPCQCYEGRRRNGGTTPLILNLVSRCRWLVKFLDRMFYSRETTPVPFKQGLDGPQSRPGRFGKNKYVFYRDWNPRPSSS